MFNIVGTKIDIYFQSIHSVNAQARQQSKVLDKNIENSFANYLIGKILYRVIIFYFACEKLLQIIYFFYKSILELVLGIELFVILFLVVWLYYVFVLFRLENLISITIKASRTKLLKRAVEGGGSQYYYITICLVILCTNSYQWLDIKKKVFLLN